MSVAFKQYLQNMQTSVSGKIKTGSCCYVSVTLLKYKRFGFCWFSLEAMTHYIDSVPKPWATTWLFF